MRRWRFGPFGETGGVPVGGKPSGPPVRVRVPVVLAGVVIVGAVVAALVFTGLGDALWGLFSDRERVQRALDGAGAMAPLVYVLFLVVQAVVAPLPAPAVAMAGGYGFGVVEGFFLTWVGCFIGGVVSFGISRLFGRRFVVGSGRSVRLDRFVDEHGAILIFVLRLVPLVSFDAISYAAGLSSIGFRSFALATALGMMPGTFAFVYFGGAQPGPWTWIVLVGLILLAVAAYVFQRRLFGVRRRVR